MLKFKLGCYSIGVACHINCLGIDPKPLVWRGFVVVLVEADWFEALGVDVQAYLPREGWKPVAVIGDAVSFSSSSCLLPGVDYSPCVTAHRNVFLQVISRSILNAVIVALSRRLLQMRPIASSSSSCGGVRRSSGLLLCILVGVWCLAI